MRHGAVAGVLLAAGALAWWLARDDDGRERAGPPPARPALDAAARAGTPAERTPFTLVAVNSAGAPVAGARIDLVYLRPAPGVARELRLRAPMPARLTGADGCATLRLPAGAFELKAFKEGLACAVASFEVPHETSKLEIVLGEEWRLEVMVRDRKTKAPVAGATVFVFQRFREYGVPDRVTDRHGVAELRGLPRVDHLLVGARPPGGGRGDPRPVRGGTRSLLLEIDVPAPAATHAAVPREATLEVSLRYSDGRPAAGREVALFADDGTRLARAAMDEQGEAWMKGLRGGRAQLCVIKSGPDDREVLGVVDLRRGDVRVEHTLPAEREVEFAITLDGKAVLPDNHLLRPPLREKTVDPARGLIRGRVVVTSSPLRATLLVPGYREARAEIAVPGGSDVIRHVFALQRGYACRVRVLGGPVGERLDLEREVEGSWRAVDPLVAFSVEETETGFVYPGLDAGRYRLHARSGVLYGGVEVGPRGPGRIVVDRRRAAWVSGRVEVPAGYATEAARVSVSGAGMEKHPRGRDGVGVDPASGAFRVRVPGDRRVSIFARHPRLAAGGSIETVGGVDGVVLRLVEAGTLRFRIPGFWRRRPRAYRPRVRVSLTGGAKTLARSVAATGREWVWGGIPPGAYRLWIGVPEGTPYTRERVAIRRGTVDLGDLPVRPGSRLTIRVIPRAPFVPPRVMVRATREDDPDDTHAVFSDGEAAVVVTGLAAGRYVVTAYPTGDRGRLRLWRGVEADGRSEVELTLDLR